MKEKIKGVITGDIIDSTSIESSQKEIVFKQFEAGFVLMTQTFKFYYEWYRGDAFQIVSDKVNEGLRLTLLVKTWIRSIERENKRPYDIRLALGIGSARIIKNDLALSDGEAFQLSGRMLDELKKGKLSFAVVSNDQNGASLNVESILVNAILENTTPMQCKILFYKLLGKKEEEIALILGLSQSTVNQHSNAGNWNALSKYVDYFEKTYLNG
jgi:hypothetical protein